MLARRLLLTVFMLVWLAFLYVACEIINEFSFTYDRWLSPFSRNGHLTPLPILTETISLPILEGHSGPFWCYMMFLFLTPCILCAFIWLVKSPQHLLEYWCYGFVIYLALLFASVFIIGAGLWFPWDII